MVSAIELLAIIPTALLLAVLFSQIFILITRKEKTFDQGYLPSVTIIIPSHNEEKHIKRTLNAALSSGYPGKLKIIAIDDGSTDKTPDILKEFSANPSVRVLKTNHIGKSRAMNKALKIAGTEIVMTIDGDTRLAKGAIERLVAPFSDKTVAATTGVIKVENHNKPLSWFQRLEYLNFAYFKSIQERINAVIAASGPLSAFRRTALIKIGGFNTKTYLEDFDVAIKLIKAGYKTHFVATAFCYTFVPEKLREFTKQRFRWTRGGAQIIKQNNDMFFNKKYRGAGMYSLPLLSYWYLHSVLIGIALILQMAHGYWFYFLSQGVVLSWDVLIFFFNWFSIFGMANVVINVILGYWTLTLLSALNIILLSLTYVMYFLALRKFADKLTFKDLVAFIFMFPYWLLLIFVHAASNIEWAKKEGRNWWKK